MQTVPKKFDSPEMKEIEIRKGFVPRKRKKMLVADFAGVELRGAATICPEPFFQQAFRHYHCRICGAEGESNTILHNCPSCGVFENEKEGFWHGADLHSMTRDEIPALNGNRNDAKAVNFAIIYLASGWTLHQQHPHLSADQWQVIIDQYMSRLKGVQAYHKRQEEIYKSGKPSYDIFGRRRFVKLPKKTADAKKYRSEYKRGLNQIVNQPIQGPCSSAFTQIAMNKLRKVWIDKGWWKTKAMILAMIHDEIVSEADEDIIEEARVDLRDAMESCEVFLDVPVRSEARVVANWYEGK
jgi:DNA polymerase I-like protein with 3'-5' exonuclease and polymerase domains